MKITEIKTYLMHAAPPDEGGWAARNWLFVKVVTDEGIYGVGEASGRLRLVRIKAEATPALKPVGRAIQSPK